jgi:hypothetical protein
LEWIVKCTGGLFELIAALLNAICYKEERRVRIAEAARQQIRSLRNEQRGVESVWNLERTASEIASTLIRWEYMPVGYKRYRFEPYLRDEPTRTTYRAALSARLSGVAPLLDELHDEVENSSKSFACTGCRGRDGHLTEEAAKWIDDRAEHIAQAFMQHDSPSIASEQIEQYRTTALRWDRRTSSLFSITGAAVLGVPSLLLLTELNPEFDGDGLLLTPFLTVTGALAGALLGCDQAACRRLYNWSLALRSMPPDWKRFAVGRFAVLAFALTTIGIVLQTIAP